MASGSNFIIRCKTENGSFTMKSVNSESTVGELKLHLSREINARPECIKILCGYPPKALADGIDSLKLQDVNICSGETIIIERINAVQVPDVEETRSGGSGPTDPVHVETPVVNANASGVMAPALDDLSGAIMMRHVVPSNNSCLFTSVYFVLTNGDLNEAKSIELRKVIAQVVASNKEKYNDAFLGMSNEAYCKWILDNAHWGGAIELSILSEHFGIEIVAVDTVSLRMHRFGESSNYTKRIFLIYDGIHYDPLIVELGNSMQTVFPVNEDYPMEMAMEIAREAKSSRQYTDVANFTLRCMICDERIIGDKEAREHALASGHNQFGEITQ